MIPTFVLQLNQYAANPASLVPELSNVDFEKLSLDDKNRVKNAALQFITSHESDFDNFALNDESKKSLSILRELSHQEFRVDDTFHSVHSERPKDSFARHLMYYTRDPQRVVPNCNSLFDMKAQFDPEALTQDERELIAKSINEFMIDNKEMVIKNYSDPQVQQALDLLKKVRDELKPTPPNPDVPLEVFDKIMSFATKATVGNALRTSKAISERSNEYIIDGLNSGKITFNDVCGVSYPYPKEIITFLKSLGDDAKRLTQFYFSDDFRPEDVKEIFELINPSKLRSFGFDDSLAKELEVYLPKLINLESLSLVDYSNEFRNFDFIQGLNSLSYLNIDSSTANFPTRLPSSLRTLELHCRTGVPDEYISSIGIMAPQLVCLRIQSGYNAPLSILQPTCFKTFTRLEELGLVYCDLTSIDSLPDSLKILSLMECKGCNIERVSRMAPQLESLLLQSDTPFYTLHLKSKIALALSESP